MSKARNVWLGTFSATEDDNGIQMGYRVFQGNLPEGIWMEKGVLFMEWDGRPLPLTTGTVLIDAPALTGHVTHVPVCDIFSTKEEAEKHVKEANANCPLSFWPCGV